MEETLNIGPKIKRNRINRDMTIRQLAELAQITSSMLSQIERGQANPSLNTLRLIALAIDVPLFSLFMDDLETEQDFWVKASQRKHLIRNGVDYELLTNDMKGVLSFYSVTLAPNTSTAEKPLAHKSEEVGLVLKGTLEFITPTGTLILNKGDSLRIQGEMPHAWHNCGDEDAVYVFAVTSSGF